MSSLIFNKTRAPGADGPDRPAALEVARQCILRVESCHGCKRAFDKETTLANNSKEARDRAEASFKKQEQRAREGAKAMADYEAEGRAMREKTARLKSLRMAKQAAGKEVVEGSEPANSRSPSSAMKPLP
jgi:hypothetical protein